MPVHRSLLTRVVVLALAVCTVSVAATAWLVVRSTGVAVQQVQGQNLRSDAIVYAGLLDHASTHPDWTGVGPLLDDLAAQTDYRIVLTAMDGTVVADSGGTADPGAAPAAEDTRVVVDPAPVDDALLRHAPGHGSDPGTTVPTPAEAAVAGEATAAPVAPAETAVPAHGPDAAQASPTAPPVRLFVTGREPYATTFLDLSLANRVRIVGLAGGVLLVAAGVSLVVGLRITRPLRTLAATAAEMSGGDTRARAPVHAPDEIGQVASAFNELAERREEQAALRRTMVGDVAHELRGPLSSIRGWLEAAQDGLVPQDDRLVASLHEEAVHLQHLVSDLQDLSLADAGELRVAPAPTDLHDLVEHVVVAHAPAARAKGVTLSAVAPGHGTRDAVAEVDAVRVRQVVTNLVSNAVRHTPPGGTIEARVVPERDTVRVEVADTGSGIAPEHLPHVFERFWRADPSRTRETGGTGLGLAVSRQIVDLHHGTLDVRSDLGAGSTFTLTLPRRAVAASDAAGTAGGPRGRR